MLHCTVQWPQVLSHGCATLGIIHTGYILNYQQVSLGSHFTEEKGEGVRGGVTCGEPALCSRETECQDTRHLSPPLQHPLTPCSGELLPAENHPSAKLG